MVTLVVSTGLLATAAAPLNVAVAKTSLTFAQACLIRSNAHACDASLVLFTDELGGLHMQYSV